MDGRAIMWHSTAAWQGCGLHGSRSRGAQQRRDRGVAYVGHVALNSGTAT